jgi:hypothetical protein
VSVWTTSLSWAMHIYAGFWMALDKDAPLSRTAKRSGRILCRPVLGGLHHEYVRIDFRWAQPFKRPRSRPILSIATAWQAILSLPTPPQGALGTDFSSFRLASPKRAEPIIACHGQ